MNGFKFPIFTRVGCWSLTWWTEKLISLKSNFYLFLWKNYLQKPGTDFFHSLVEHHGVQGRQNRALCANMVGYEVFWAQTRFELTPILNDNFSKFWNKIWKCTGWDSNSRTNWQNNANAIPQRYNHYTILSWLGR